VEAFGPTSLADREVLFGEDSAAYRPNVGIRHREENQRIPLVRWPHPRGLPPASEALAGVGGTSESSELVLHKLL
jgi:hypothetical protein